MNLTMPQEGRRDEPGMGGFATRSVASRPDRCALQLGHGHGAFGEACNGGGRADAFELFGDAGRYVLDGFEVDVSDFLCLYLAVEGDAGFLQSVGEELDLPLVVLREAGGVDGLEHSLRGVVFEEHVAEVAVGWEAVVAAGDGDYEAAVGDDLGGGGHALHRLVEVLVEGVAAVGGDDYRVLVLAGDHDGGLARLAASLVGGYGIAAVEAGDLALAV